MDYFGVDLMELIRTVGLLGLFAIVFAETGLFLGFFLPGDSLLFVAGLLAAQGLFPVSMLILVLLVAAITGNITGYWFGKKVGPKLFEREDSLLFRKAQTGTILLREAWRQNHHAGTLHPDRADIRADRSRDRRDEVSKFHAV